MVDRPAILLRPAVATDAELLYRWRNDPGTREASRRFSPVTWDEHEKWLSQSLASADRIIRLAQEGRNTVGVVRADRTLSGWELSWTVAPEARGRGVGTKMLQAFADDLDGELVAVVRKTNMASARMAEASGFKLAGDAEDPAFDRWVR